MIDPAEAVKQADSLFEAADKSPIRQYRYELRSRALEWKRALKDLGESSEGVIELVGSVSSGMKVLYPTHDEDWASVIRVLSRDGQVSLHIQDGTGRPQYINYATPSSPVVVRS